MDSTEEWQRCLCAMSDIEVGRSSVGENCSGMLLMAVSGPEMGGSGAEGQTRWWCSARKRRRSLAILRGKK